jgi:hypothetical protein
VTTQVILLFVDGRAEGRKKELIDFQKHHTDERECSGRMKNGLFGFDRKTRKTNA